MAVQETAERQRLAETTDTLRERLPMVWDMLPEDAQSHLIDAQINLDKQKRRDASLDYAISVEEALKGLLQRPKTGRNWPHNLGAWVARLRQMVAPNAQRDFRDQEFRRSFDIKYAAQLADALEVFEQGRLARAHGVKLSPSANIARNIALGIEQPSVFELILRFGQRWRG